MRLKKDLSFFSRAALTLLLMFMTSVSWAQGIGTDFYTLTLDPNYDGGSIINVPNIASGTHITLNEALTPTRSGYYCIGWSSEPSGDGEVFYGVGSTITVNSNRTLYAIWEEGKAFFDGNIRYKVTSESPKTAELMYYVGNMTTGTILTIPAKVSDYAVTSIDENAFKNCSSLTSITIPASVTSIGKNAFSYCSSLTSVNFASGSQLTTIGQGAFYQTGLTSITIPASVTTIVQDVFSYCSSLTTVNFASGSQLTTIGQDAFSYCSSLTTVNFASGSQLTTIGEGAFYKTGLTSITIPASVTTIGQDAFNACSSLASVNFASGSQLTSIGQGAFYVTGLTSITIPASVTSIGQYAFYGCSSLASVNFESGSQLTTIGASAFQGSGLTSITIPASVTTIGDNPFALCRNMTSITVDGSNLNFKDIDGVLYSKDEKTIISYPIGKPGASYTIPDGVTTIGASAFQGADLASITFPASITTIGQAAFLACNNLASVTLYSNPSIDQNAFQTTNITMNLTANNVGSDYWMTFYNDRYNFQADANTTVYKAKISGSSLALTAVTDRIVTAGKAVILKSTGNPVMTRVLDGSADTYSNNDLQGTMTEDVTPLNCYTLAAKSGVVGFYKYEGSTIAAGKAYLIYSGSGARTFYSFSDDATAIEAPEVVGDSDDGDIYDLMGRKMQGQPIKKGIYVKQGKKYIVK